MRKLIILALTAICFVSCGNATVVHNEPDEPKTDTTSTPDKPTVPNSVR